MSDQTKSTGLEVVAWAFRSPLNQVSKLQWRKPCMVAPEEHGWRPLTYKSDAEASIAGKDAEIERLTKGRDADRASAQASVIDIEKVMLSLEREDWCGDERMSDALKRACGRLRNVALLDVAQEIIRDLCEMDEPTVDDVITVSIDDLARRIREAIAQQAERIAELEEALRPKPLRDGLVPHGYTLEATHNNAEFWQRGGHNEPDRLKALMCIDQAVNAWKNAAYAKAKEALSLQTRIAELGQDAALAKAREPTPDLFCGSVAISADPRFAGWVFVRHVDGINWTTGAKLTPETWGMALAAIEALGQPEGEKGGAA